MPENAQAAAEPAAPLAEYQPCQLPVDEAVQAWATRTPGIAPVHKFVEAALEVGIGAVFALPPGLVDIKFDGESRPIGIPGQKALQELAGKGAWSAELAKAIEARGPSPLGAELAGLDVLLKQIGNLRALVSLVGLVARIVEILAWAAVVFPPALGPATIARQVAAILSRLCPVVVKALTMVELVVQGLRSALSGFAVIAAFARGDPDRWRAAERFAADLLDFGVGAYCARRAQVRAAARPAPGGPPETLRQTWDKAGAEMSNASQAAIRAGGGARAAAVRAVRRGVASFHRANRKVREESFKALSTRAVAGAMADERAQWAAKSAVSLVTAPMREAGAARKLPPRPSGRLRERADGLAARASDPWARSAVAPLLPAGPSSPGLADAPATGSADLLKRLIEVQSRRQALRAADAEHRHAEAAAAEGAADQQARAQAAAEHEAKAGEAARHAAFAVGQALAREEAARRGQNQCGQQGEQANRGGAEVRAVADQAQGTPAVEAPPAPEGFLDKMLAVTLGPVREHAAQVQAGITQAVLDAVSGVAGLDDLGQAACQEGEGMAARRELAEKERSDAQAMAETAAADAAWAQQEASDARSKARAAEDAARELAAQRGEMAQEDQSLGAEEASLVAAIVAEAQEVASRGETSPDLPDLGSIQAAGALLAALAGTAITEIDAAAVDVIDAVAAEFESLSGRKDIADAAADEAAKASAEAAGPAREALAELPGDVDLAVGQAEATGGDGIAAGLDALAAELDAVRGSALDALAGLAASADRQAQEAWDEMAALASPTGGAPDAAPAPPPTSAEPQPGSPSE